MTKTPGVLFNKLKVFPVDSDVFSTLNINFPGALIMSGAFAVIIVSSNSSKLSFKMILK